MAEESLPLVEWPEPDHEYLARAENQSAEWAFKDKDAFLQKRYRSLAPMEFYRLVFPEGSFERAGHPDDHKGNGIAVVIDNETKRARKTIVTDGLEQVEGLVENDFVVMSPVSYFGRSNRSANALWLHALALDIDYVNITNLDVLVDWFENIDVMPRPTAVVNSGHGVHLYYVLEQPVAMYEQNQAELVKLKKGLVERIWTRYTSYRPERREALGIVQNFRMVGSPTKMALGSRLAAYETGPRVTLDHLNGYVPAASQAHVNQPSLFSREDAKSMYPDWYERRIVRGEQPGRWHVKRDLYDWFVRKIEEGATVGHRYFCVMCLAAYAVKCDIPEDELREDARRLHGHLNRLGDKTGEPFEWEEAEKALECYNESYVNFPRETIERITAIAMPANKRNHRTQEQHIKVMNAIRDTLDPDGSWRKKGGRPDKRREIQNYSRRHPNASHSEIARALGFSRTTVIKWLKNQGEA